jgi:hypothetical protein
MAELARFVRARNINNVTNGIVNGTRDDNPLLFEIEMPNRRVLTLPAAQDLGIIIGDVVQIVTPSGNQKQAFVSDRSAVLLGDEPINKVLGLGSG